MLADVKEALQSTVNSADKTYADSDGKVQNNAVRGSLKTVLDAAKKVLSVDGVTDTKDYMDRKTAVDNAAKTVNDSIAAKAQTDAEAAAASSAAAFGGSYSGSGSSSYQVELVHIMTAEYLIRISLDRIRLTMKPGRINFGKI